MVLVLLALQVAQLVRYLHLDPRGRFFVSGVFDGDRELQVASLKDGHRLGTLMVFGDFQWLYFTPDLLRQTLHLDAAPVAVPGAAKPVR